jgi:hypothetical protein
MGAEAIVSYRRYDRRLTIVWCVRHLVDVLLMVVEWEE